MGAGLRAWGAPGGPGLGLRLPPGGSEAVLSGVGLQEDSLDSSSSEEERGSPEPEPEVPLFLEPEPLEPPEPLELAARSCLRNLALRF